MFGSQLPQIFGVLLFVTSSVNTAVRDSRCLLAENHLSLCPTLRVPVGLDAMLMNYHARKKGFAKLFIFSSPKCPFPHSHMNFFFSPTKGQIRSWQQTNAREG